MPFYQLHSKLFLCHSNHRTVLLSDLQFDCLAILTVVFCLLVDSFDIHPHIGASVLLLLGSARNPGMQKRHQTNVSIKALHCQAAFDSQQPVPSSRQPVSVNGQWLPVNEQ